MHSSLCCLVLGFVFLAHYHPLPHVLQVKPPWFWGSKPKSPLENDAQKMPFALTPISCQHVLNWVTVHEAMDVHAGETGTTSTHGVAWLGMSWDPDSLCWSHVYLPHSPVLDLQFCLGCHDADRISAIAAASMRLCLHMPSPQISPDDLHTLYLGRSCCHHLFHINLWMVI